MQLNNHRTLLLISLFVSLFLNTELYPQNKKTDSLLFVLKTIKEDTNKVLVLQQLSSQLRHVKFDTSLFLLEQSITLAKKLGFQKGLARSYHSLGHLQYNNGDYNKSIESYHSALKIYQVLSVGSDEGSREFAKYEVIRTIDNIGIVYLEQGDDTQALSHFLKSLKMAEALLNASKDNHSNKKAKKQIANTLGNIGVVYDDQNDYPKALDYHTKAFEMAKDIGNKELQAGNLGNIGSIYHELGDYSKALDYYFKALHIAEKIENKNRLAILYSDIGLLYAELGVKSKQNPMSSDTCSPVHYFRGALACYLTAFKLAEENKNKNRIAAILGYLGSLYTKMGQFKESETVLKKAIAIAKAIGDNDGMKNFEWSLSALYDTTGRYQLAYKHYGLFILYRDSIANEENVKEQTRLEMQYELDKRESEARNEQEKKDLSAIEEKQKQKIYFWFTISGFAIIVLIAGFIFRNLRLNKKKNRIISEQKALVEEQKAVVEEKQREILDSIYYARRIQRALITNEQYISRKLADLKK